MRRPLLPVLLCCVLAVGCTGRTGTDNQVTNGPRQISVGGQVSRVIAAGDREPAPALSGRTLEGDQLDVSDLRGKIVVLNFWADWCAPCRAEARNLNAVYAATKASGVEFVGINFKDDQTRARAFQRSKAVEYPSLFDPNGLLLLKFRGKAPQSPPSTFVLDREGRIAATFFGPVTENQLLIPVQVLAKEVA